ncbi:MAG: N-acetyltransferase [Myxococcales bacterium]|nr:N-acetyltransferase [Myxococcales bacterium]MCB9707177.1 N-acetyltransferase [Myxococcales bacterium]
MSALIHSTAVLDAHVHIGEGSRVWHFVHISEYAAVGKNCVIGQNVFIGKGVHIGNGVKIQNNVSVYSGVHIDDDVFLGPSCVFTNVLEPRAFVEQKEAFGQTHVERGATVGANATIVCGNRIGRYSMVAAGAVITRNVAPYALVMGVPGRQRGWVCRCGQKVEHAPEDLPDRCSVHSS